MVPEREEAKLLDIDRSMVGTRLTPEARSLLCARLARLFSAEGGGEALKPPKKLMDEDMGKTVYI
jgi:hypothetical protein